MTKEYHVNLDPLRSIHGLPILGTFSGSIPSCGPSHQRKHEMSSDANDSDELELSEEADNIPKHQPGVTQAGDSDTAGGSGNLDVTV